MSKYQIEMGGENNINPIFRLYSENTPMRGRTEARYFAGRGTNDPFVTAILREGAVPGQHVELDLTDWTVRIFDPLGDTIEGLARLDRMNQQARGISGGARKPIDEFNQTLRDADQVKEWCYEMARAVESGLAWDRGVTKLPESEDIAYDMPGKMRNEPRNTGSREGVDDYRFEVEVPEGYGPTGKRRRRSSKK